MALVVETGAGVANAESYASVAEATAYLAARGDTVWAALALAKQEGNLRNATEYMQGMYGGRWLGLRSTLTQALDHPRQDIPVADVKNAVGTTAYYTATELLSVVKAACIVLALKANDGPLAADMSRALVQDTVGPITQKWDKGSSQRVRYVAVDAMLRPFLKPATLSVRVGRA